MPLWSHDESIDGLTDIRLLGYFESVKSIFLTKLAMLWSCTDHSTERFLPSRFNANAIQWLTLNFDFPHFFRALSNPQNEHLVANMMNDIVTAAHLEAWMVFEQMIKDLPSPNYAHNPAMLDANYNRGLFGLSAAEKANLDLFYYIRNAIVHYNGAYYAGTNIEHYYRGEHYKSAGHEGEHIDLGLDITWHILNDIEQYALKAWTNWTNWKKAGQSSP